MLNNITKLLKELFGMVLFVFLIITMPVWILPYTIIIKRKQEKYESEAKK